MPVKQRHSDLTGRILALLVFLAGVGCLAFVFVTALHLFRDPVPGLALPIRPGAPAPPAASIGAALALFLRQLLLLALMTVAGSLIAGKGVHLYFSALHGPVTEATSVPVNKNGHAAAPPVEKKASKAEPVSHDTPA